LSLFRRDGALRRHATLENSAFLLYAI